MAEVRQILYIYPDFVPSIIREVRLDDNNFGIDGGLER